MKLVKEIGQAKAAKELGVPSAMTLNEELLRLRQQVKELEKEIRLLKKENDFLEEASAFFAASRLKSAKTKE